ncbi:glycosyltransferase family 2 protein [Paenibacillus septentrionalis]|uniref:Glycosyltransferase family 2 protein n=1 Tax=Paenibacillus septentrionalis TaxID=429342 RepID=A0ABW1V8L2_9BACL
MNNEVILSIIIPMYNSEQTIRKCIDSVNIGMEVEILLIDDGSIDNTREICESYMRSCPNLRYYYQNNKGPGAARNKGIHLAKGKYVMFVDSDDFIESKQLKNILDTYLYQHHDLLYFNFRQVDDKGNLIKSYKLNAFSNLKTIQLINNTLSWRLPWGQFKIIRRGLLEDGDITFNENSNESEELILTISCLEQSSQVIFIDSIVYNYVKREGSLSTSHDAFSLYNKRYNMINLLKKEYTGKYDDGVVNYEFASIVQFLKLFAEQNISYKVFKKKVEIGSILKKVDIRYLDKRYRYIYYAMKFKLDRFIFLLFKLRRRYYSGKCSEKI